MLSSLSVLDDFNGRHSVWYVLLNNGQISERGFYMALVGKMSNEIETEHQDFNPRLMHFQGRKMLIDGTSDEPFS